MGSGHVTQVVPIKFILEFFGKKKMFSLHQSFLHNPIVTWCIATTIKKSLSLNKVLAEESRTNMRGGKGVGDPMIWFPISC